MLDPLSPFKAFDNHWFIIQAARRNQNHHRLANDFLGSVTKDTLGTSVPTGYDAVQGLTNDRVLRGLDDSGQASKRGLLPLALCNFRLQVFVGRRQGQ